MVDATEPAGPYRVRVLEDGVEVRTIVCASWEDAQRLVQSWEPSVLRRFELEPVPADEVDEPDPDDYPHS